MFAGTDAPVRGSCSAGSRVAIRGIGSCKLKLGVEKRDAGNKIRILALAPTSGVFAAVAVVAF
jgi:hypothetical protein